MVFNSLLRRSFNHILEVVGSMESEWAMFCTAIVEVVQSCVAKTFVLVMELTPETACGHQR